MKNTPLLNLLKKIIIILLLNLTMVSAQNPGGWFNLSLDYINNTYSNFYKAGFNLVEEDMFGEKGSIGHISINIKDNNINNNIFVTTNAKLFEFLRIYKSYSFSHMPKNPPLTVLVWGGTVLDYNKSCFFEKDINWVTAKYGYALNRDIFYSYEDYSSRTSSMFRDFIPTLFTNIKIGYHSIIIGNENFNLIDFPINDDMNGPTLGLNLLMGILNNLGRLGDCDYYCTGKLELGLERFFSKKNLNIISINAGLQFAIADNSAYDMSTPFTGGISSLFYPLLITLKYKKMFIFLPGQIDAHGFEIGLSTNLIGQR
ncbi:hypothetical protein ACFLSQ_08845 [Bacteroidota bacterium]